MEEKEWKTDIKNWTKISESTAKIMLDQSETSLKETIETAKVITAKADKLISLLFPAIIALVVYLGNNLLCNPINFLTITAFFSLIVLLISFKKAYNAFKQYKIEASGDYPSRIFRTELIDKDFTEKQQYINVVLSISENIQRKILFNKSCNAIRTSDNHISMDTLKYLFFCPIVSFLFLALCHHLHYFRF